MKLLYVHQHFSTPQGGAGTRSYEMAREMLRRGHEVVMLCGSFGAGNTGLSEPFKRGVRTGMVDGIQVIEFDLSYSNSMPFYMRVVKFLQFTASSSLKAVTLKYDVIVCSSTPLTAGIPGLVSKLLRRKKFVFEVRDLWPELPVAMGVIKNKFVIWGAEQLEKTLYNTADSVIALSSGMKEGITSKLKRPKDVNLVPNGCDLGLFARTDEVESDFDGLTAIFSGTHGIANGLEHVLDAAAELKARDVTNVRIMLVGDGMMKPKLVERAKQEGLDNVVFRDNMPKTELVKVMQAADIGIQSLDNVPAFYFGTSPNKFFDYLACGLPVIVNYPGWVASLVEGHGAGYAVPPESPSAFADALVSAAMDADLAEKGRAARALAESQFDRKDLTEKWANAVEKVA